MRNMSFAFTTQQVLEQTKTVTRRLGWTNLRAGDHIRAVRKCMGLRLGEHVEPLAVLRIVDVRRESLRKMADNLEYGFTEVAAEGFGEHPRLRWPSEFISFFCDTHRGCTPEPEVTRIEFAYVGANAQGERRTE